MEEKDYKDFKKGAKEFQDARREDSWLYMNKPRLILDNNGEKTLSLWAYGKLPLRLMSDAAGFLANLRKGFKFFEFKRVAQRSNFGFEGYFRPVLDLRGPFGDFSGKKRDFKIFTFFVKKTSLLKSARFHARTIILYILLCFRR